MIGTRSDVADVMAVTLSRLIRTDDVVGVGLGTPLALVAGLMARHRPEGSVHVLAGGALDMSGDIEAWLLEPAKLVGRTPGFVSHFDSMDMAERQAMTLQILRPAQVDSAGNLNTSRIGPPSAPTARFSGGLATADVPALLPRIAAYHPDHRRRSLPGRVDWITGNGTGWSGERFTAAGTVALVTNLGVVEYVQGGPRLASVHPWSSTDEITANTGFALAESASAGFTVLPTSEECSLLDAVDPARRRDNEIPDVGRLATEVTS